MYYYPRNNQRFFETPFLVTDLTSLNRVIETLRSGEILQDCLLNRPDTKWSFFTLTNVNYFVNKLSFSIGSAAELPWFILNSKFSHALVKDRYGRPYEDNLCFFRCLALCKTRCGINTQEFERNTQYFFQFYLERTGVLESQYSGVNVWEIDNLAKTFELNICIF